MTQLYKVCASHSLLPQSLLLEAPTGTRSNSRRRGVTADVLRHRFGDQEVAVKVSWQGNLTSGEVVNVSRDGRLLCRGTEHVFFRGYVGRS